jgi:hypothetical protein
MSRNTFHILALAAMLTAQAACSSAGPTAVSYENGPEGIQAGYVSVSATSAGLVVVNQTEAPVYTFAIERNASAYTDWVPCTSTATCSAGIAPGATSTIPWSKVPGYSAGAQEYQLFWWHLVTVNGNTTVAGVQNVIVTR